MVVLLITGSLIIGFIASDQQALGKPLQQICSKGFSYILTRYGIVSGRKLNDFFKSGWFSFFFAIIIPLINGIVVAYLSHLITDDIGNRFIFAVLASSASYIAVPAGMKIAVQKQTGIFPAYGTSYYFSF
jgi:hypothetical protein